MFRPQSRLCVYSLAVCSFGFRRKDGLPPETRGRNTHDNSSAERSPCPRLRQSPTKSRRRKVTKVLHPVWQQDINASTRKRERIPPGGQIYIGQLMRDPTSGAKTIRHLRIVRRVHAQRNGEHPVHALEQKFVKFDRASFARGWSEEFF